MIEFSYPTGRCEAAMERTPAFEDAPVVDGRIAHSDHDQLDEQLVLALRPLEEWDGSVKRRTSLPLAVTG